MALRPSCQEPFRLALRIDNDSLRRSPESSASESEMPSTPNINRIAVERAAKRAASACLSGFECARHFAADLACVFGSGLQLRLKVLDLNADGFLEIPRAQKVFHEIPVCGNFPLEMP